MVSIFDKLGIRFQYPENWQLDESEIGEEFSTITVYSPAGAFWSVSNHPAKLDPGKLADRALQTMRGEYQDLDSEKVHESIAGLELVGYDMNFYCLDLTNTAQVRGFRAGDRVWLVLYQADDREYAAIEPVFRAITTSLLAGVASEPA